VCMTHTLKMALFYQTDFFRKSLSCLFHAIFFMAKLNFFCDVWVFLGVDFLCVYPFFPLRGHTENQ